MTLSNSPELAIRFGENADKGLDPVSVIPFSYSLIPSRDDTWDRDKGTDNMTGMGPTVGPGATVRHVVQLDGDLPWKMHSFRVCAYTQTLAGLWIWMDNPAGFFFDIANEQSSIGTPILRYLLVSLVVNHNNRIIVGGHGQADQWTTPAANMVNGKIPMPILVQQGNEYGDGQLYLEHWFPREGQVVLEFTNTHRSYTLRVGGCLQGWKVRI